MAYDEDLAERIRSHVSDLPTTERKMFGGLAFLIGGHMAVAVSGQGGLMVRVDPADTERRLAEDGAHPMVMNDRELTGWLRVTSEAVDREDDLARWVQAGVDYARTLPPK